jgi:hypothetical protein
MEEYEDGPPKVHQPVPPDQVVPLPKLGSIVYCGGEDGWPGVSASTSRTERSSYIGRMTQAIIGIARLAFEGGRVTPPDEEV